jgi:hypothetical protein
MQLSDNEPDGILDALDRYSAILLLSKFRYSIQGEIITDRKDSKIKNGVMVRTKAIRLSVVSN